MNKANLRDLIAATSLEILLKFDQIIDFFIPYDLEIRWMTLKNNRTPLLGHIKPCALFESHQGTQTGVTIWKHSIQVRIGDFFAPSDIEIWWMIWKNNRAPLQGDFKLCASFRYHRSIQTGVTVWKLPIRVKNGDIFYPVWPENLTDDLEKQ